MIDGGFGDKTNCLFTNPLPVGYVFVHDVGFECGMRFEIDDLKVSSIFTCNDFGCWMRDCDTLGHDKSVDSENYSLFCRIDIFAIPIKRKSD